MSSKDSASLEDLKKRTSVIKKDTQYDILKTFKNTPDLKCVSNNNIENLLKNIDFS